MPDQLPDVQGDVGFVEATPVQLTDVDALGRPVVVHPPTPFQAADGRRIQVVSSLGVLFSDDFGGNAVDATRWDVIDGGLAATTTNQAVSQIQGGPVATFTQNAIGSGTTGMTDGVSASALTVHMGTTNGAERWYMSRQIFAGTEDIMVVLNTSQRLAANSIFIGLVEVDLATGIPLLNPNLANDFTNRGGVEIGKSGSGTAYNCEAVSDSSNSVATGTAGVAAVTFNTGDELFIEFEAEDIIASTMGIDGINARASSPARVASQVPNDAKAYKLLIRFRNVSLPGSGTDVTIQRVLLIDRHELRTEITSGRGDQAGTKGVPVNPASPALIGLPNQTGNVLVNSSALSSHKLVSAATTNATSVKSSASRIFGGLLYNASGATKFFKIYNKASAPTVGTDIPDFTIPIPAGATVSLASLFPQEIGYRCSAGIAYAITGLAADSDTTAVAAGDVVVNLSFN